MIDMPNVPPEIDAAVSLVTAYFAKLSQDGKWEYRGLASRSLAIDPIYVNAAIMTRKVLIHALRTEVKGQRLSVLRKQLDCIDPNDVKSEVIHGGTDDVVSVWAEGYTTEGGRT